MEHDTVERDQNASSRNQRILYLSFRKKMGLFSHSLRENRNFDRKKWVEKYNSGQKVVVSESTKSVWNVTRVGEYSN